MRIRQSLVGQRSPNLATDRMSNKDLEKRKENHGRAGINQRTNLRVGSADADRAETRDAAVFGGERLGGTRQAYRVRRATTAASLRSARLELGCPDAGRSPKI